MNTRLTTVCATIFVLSGCASTAQNAPVSDRFETANRAIYAFNETFDKYTLKPVAKGYRKIVPRVARSGVSNFFENLTTPRSSLNNFLQGKPSEGFTDLGRFFINSTIGIGGLVDVASKMDIPEYGEDFGQTFAVWGIPSGPYIYLPFLGPSTVTDTVSIPIDRLAHPVYYYENTSVRDKLNVLQIVDLRARLLSFDDIIMSSEDPYIAVREAYLQNRAFRIYDGNPPTSQEEEDLFDEFLNED